MGNTDKEMKMSMRMSAYIAILIALFTSLPVKANQDVPIDTTSGIYPYRVDLDENYELKWNFNSTHVVFETRVKTNGYIGFGISGSGAMHPADMIIGWVSNGKVHFADRHSTGHSMPVMDTTQDWQLVNSSEIGQYTTLTMIRMLDTCDTQDFAIKEGTTRVIYCYGISDPTTDNVIDYHGSLRRGTKSLLLLDPPAIDAQSKPLPSDVISFDFLEQNYSVPAVDTTYACSMWKLPNITGKHHMIKYAPVIQKGNEMLVHHVLIYFCSGNFLDDSVVGTRFNCYDDQAGIRPPHVHSQCNHVFLSWAIGGNEFIYPDHVGHSLGTSRDPTYFRMEIHYDNPRMRSDIVDSSGIRMYLTKQLRQYDAGIIEAGVHVDRYQIIPPYNSDFLSQGFCHQDCIAEALGDQEIHVFANMLHSHLLGRKLRTRIIRNGVELPRLQEDNNYDFNFQEQRRLFTERTIKKGDALIVECNYDSTQRTGITYGGLSTRQEMCLSFILYYPRSSLSTCLSRTMPNIDRHMDWTKKDVQDAFAKHVRESIIQNVCIAGDKYLKFNYRRTPQINVTKTYDPPSTCGN